MTHPEPVATSAGAGAAIPDNAPSPLSVVPRPGSRAARMRQPLAKDALRQLAEQHQVCVRPVVLRRTDTVWKTLGRALVLRESERHLRSFMESASDFVLFRLRHRPETPYQQGSLVCIDWMISMPTLKPPHEVGGNPQIEGDGRE